MQQQNNDRSGLIFKKKSSIRFAAGSHRHLDSSPRVWGTPATLSPQSVSQRFIPTRVGNTISEKSVHQSHPVHPHACGEHSIYNWNEFSGHGSSPRVWGTRGIRSC